MMTFKNSLNKLDKMSFEELFCIQILLNPLGMTLKVMYFGELLIVMYVT
jgi:hypothetical protein